MNAQEMQDYDSLRWDEMTGRMEKMTTKEREAYRLRCEAAQEAVEEYLRKVDALMDRQEDEFQM